MDMMKVQYLFRSHSGVMRAKELLNKGIDYRTINTLIGNGYISKIRYGYYQWNDGKADREAVLIDRYFPDAVLCMNSALRYYGYIQSDDSVWHLAVDRCSTKTRFKIESPVVRPYFCDAKRLAVGIDPCEIDGVRLRIFDREHLLCDLLHYQNKIDPALYNCALQAYFLDPKKDLRRLVSYAKVLREEKKIHEVLDEWHWKK